MSWCAHFDPATSLGLLIAHFSCSDLADGGPIPPTHGRRKENRNKLRIINETIKRLVFSDMKVSL